MSRPRYEQINDCNGELVELIMHGHEMRMYHRIQLLICNENYNIAGLKNRIYHEKFIIEQLYLEMKYAPYERQRQMAMRYRRFLQGVLFELQYQLSAAEIELEYATDDLYRLISYLAYAQRSRVIYEQPEMEDTHHDIVASSISNKRSVIPLSYSAHRKPVVQTSSHYTSKLPINRADERLAIEIYDRYIAQQNESKDSRDETIDVAAHTQIQETSLGHQRDNVVLKNVDNIKDQASKTKKQTVSVHNESSDSDSEDL